MTHTTDTAGKVLRVSPRTIRRHALRQQIGQMHGRDWIFSPEDLQRLRGLVKTKQETT
jgi:hypothetical protein